MRLKPTSKLAFAQGSFWSLYNFCDFESTLATLSTTCCGVMGRVTMLQVSTKYARWLNGSINPSLHCHSPFGSDCQKKIMKVFLVYFKIRQQIFFEFFFGNEFL